MIRQMIEDINLKIGERKNGTLRRAGKPRPYLDIKDLGSDREYKRPIYFCPGRGEVSSPALPISPTTHFYKTNIYGGSRMRRKIEVFLRQINIGFMTSFISLDTFFSSLLPPYQFLPFATGGVAPPTYYCSWNVNKVLQHGNTGSTEFKSLAISTAIERYND